MEFVVKKVGEGNIYGFPSHDMNVWISESDKELLFNTISSDGPEYVKIESINPLSRFVFFAKIATINPQREDLGSGLIWIPTALLHKSWIIEKNSKVYIDTFNVESLPIAESVSIKLNENEVKNWANDEVYSAEISVRKNIGIAFIDQMLFVNPKTKKVVIGEIDSIYPKSDDYTKPFKIESTTKINFVGLPTESQKVIDFNSIGGLSHIVNRLREIIQIPINYPEYLERFGIKPPKGMLMYGPPGNGKTMIARAVAHSMGSSFIIIEGQELMSKYVGVGEQRLREKFDEAESKGNCVIFIDEIDSIAPDRNTSNAEFQISIVSTLLALMDGMRSTNRIFVIGATNRINSIDSALRRPGRFDLEFEVPLPNTNARRDILTKYIKLEDTHLFDNTVSDDMLSMLSELTNGYSGADISLLYREAVMNSIRKCLTFDDETGRIQKSMEAEYVQLSSDDFYIAMRSITPTSLRGIDVLKSQVEWDNIIALDDQKRVLTEIHSKMENHISNNNLKQRLSFLNILLKGIRGSGKRTLLHAFSRKFNYEIIEIDFISLVSLTLDEACHCIDQMFVKGKQIAPTLIILKNLDKVEKISFFANKIENELSKINKHQRIIVVLSCEDIDGLPESLLGYKGFETVIDMNQDVDIFLPQVLNYVPEFESTKLRYVRSVGQALSIIYENQKGTK